MAETPREISVSVRVKFDVDPRAAGAIIQDFMDWYEEESGVELGERGPLVQRYLEKLNSDPDPHARPVIFAEGY